MRPNPVRKRLAEGGVAIGPMIFEFFTPGLMAILDQAGADFVILDMEHSGAGPDTIRTQLALARGLRIAPFVRPPGLASHLISPLLDAGALGIMGPLVETADQAQALVDACRYRSEGRRGLGFSVAHDDFGTGDVLEKIRLANERTLVIALIESRRGIENVRDIMRVPGIDVGWMGHFDFTDSIGRPGAFGSPEFQEAVDELLAACRETGKAAGILSTSPREAMAWRERGFRCLGYGHDAGLFRDALASGIGEIRGGTS